MGRTLWDVYVDLLEDETLARAIDARYQGSCYGGLRDYSASIAEGNRSILFTDMLTLLAPHTVLATERFVHGGLSQVTEAAADRIRSFPGCSVRVGVGVARLEQQRAGGDAAAAAVCLADGQRIECDAVVVAVNPNALGHLTRLAEALEVHQKPFVTVLFRVARAPGDDWTLVFNADTGGCPDEEPVIHSVVQVAECMGTEGGLTRRDLLAYLRPAVQREGPFAAADLQRLLRQQLPALLGDAVVVRVLHQHAWAGACSVNPRGAVAASVHEAARAAGMYLAGDVFARFPYHMEHACESGDAAAHRVRADLLAGGRARS